MVESLAPQIAETLLNPTIITPNEQETNIIMDPIQDFSPDNIIAAV